MNQNIYDNNDFFAEYKETREKDTSYNNLLEQPVMALLLPNLKGKRILDIGCGAGYNCKQFIEKGAAFCLGIDISNNMLSLAKSMNFDKNIEYKNLAIQDLSIIKDKFDFIYSSLAFHYVEDYSKIFYDIKNLLKSSGELLFSIENPVKTASKADTKWHKDENGNSIYYELSDYLTEGERTAKWLDSSVIKYHHSFSYIINALIKNNFLIEYMEEPLPNPDAILKNPKLAREHHAPCFLIIKARVE